MLYSHELNYFDVVETEKFYYALSSIGTDFTLMLKVFPNKTRADLKVTYLIHSTFTEFLLYAVLSTDPVLLQITSSVQIYNHFTLLIYSEC